LKVLRHYQRNSYKDASKAAIRDDVHREIDGIMEGFFSYLLERNLNSPAIIRDFDRTDPDEQPSNIAAS
jgi:recombinational DNA repair protein (RecF pathway)